MNKLSLLAIFQLLLITGFSQTYFEGNVVYEASYESSIPGISAAELKERLGSKLTYHVKNENYARFNSDENDDLLSKNIYIGKKKVSYYIDMNNPDTAYYNFTTDTLFTISDINEGEEEIILGHRCRQASITLSHFSNLVQDTMKIRLTYFFSDQLPVNPDWYKGYVYWIDLVKKYRGVALKFTEETIGLYKVTYTAVSINKGKEDNGLFEIGKNVVLKKTEL